MKKSLLTLILAAGFAFGSATLCAHAEDTEEQAVAVDEQAEEQQAPDPYSLTLTDEEKAERYYNHAVELHMAGRVPEAINFYKNAVFLDPEVAAYHADLGEAYRVAGDTRSAIMELETAIQIDPTLVNALTTIGVIYESVNLPQRAIEYHRMAVAMKPDHYIGYNNLGHAYDLLGLTKAAVANYKKAIQLKPDFAPAYDNLGTTLMRMGTYPEGLEMIKKAISLTSADNPQLGLFYNDLGAAYVMMKDFRGAHEALAQAIRIMPDNMEIRRNYEYINEYINGATGK